MTVNNRTPNLDLQLPHPTNELSVDVVRLIDAIEEVDSSIFLALKRTYKEAGYNLVDGSFSSGGELESATDVLYQASTKKAFAWAGTFPKTVPEGSTPGSTGGIAAGAWVDVSNVSFVESLGDPDSQTVIGGTKSGKYSKAFDSYQAMVANVSYSISKEGQKANTGSGVWKIVSRVTPTAISNTTPQLYAIPLNGVWFQDFGADPTAAADSRSALLACWGAAPYGATIRYGLGHYYISGAVTHPLKMLFHKGEGVALGLPYNNTSYQTGTALIFKTLVEDGEDYWGVYMPPRDDLAPFDTCRYSSFSDMTFIGDGVDDSTGTRTLLKINNLTTNLNNFTTRYCALGIEANYMVASVWNNVNAVGKMGGFEFVYDPVRPYDASNTSVVTMCQFNSVVGNCPAKLPGAVGWYVDSTCLYGGNSHSSFNMESCYVGAIFEGRISSKDTDDFEALGAGAWRYGGNTFNGVWFEGNTQSNLILSYDPGETPPSLIFNGGFYEDVNSIIGVSTSLVRRGDTLTPLTPDVNERPQGSVGDYSNPYTSGQFLLSGPRISTPLTTTLVNERVPHQIANRPNANIKSSFEFDVFTPTIPLIGSALKIGDLYFANSVQSATLEVTAVGTDASDQHHCLFGRYLVTNTADSIDSIVVSQEHNGGVTQPFYVQAIKVSSNNFGIFAWKDASLVATTPCTLSVKIVVGGSSSAPSQAELIVAL